MTWRQVFDSNHRDWRYIEEAAKAGQSVGYKFFCWNGRIYDTETIKDTGILVEDIQ